MRRGRKDHNCGNVELDVAAATDERHQNKVGTPSSWAKEDEEDAMVELEVTRIPAVTEKGHVLFF